MFCIAGNILIGELVLEARNRIMDHSHPEGIFFNVLFFFF